MGVIQIILRVSFVAMLIKLAMAIHHIAEGPSDGWDTNSDLQSWAPSQQFSVGDNLAVLNESTQNSPPVSPAAAYPPIADSPTISIPSAAPGETGFVSPADSPESPSLFFETQTETYTLSSMFPSSESVPPYSPLAQHTQDASASWNEKENLQAFISSDF